MGDKDKKLTMNQMTGQGGDTYVVNDNHETNDEISMLAISELLNMKKLKTISRIKFEQVPVLTKLYMFNDVFANSNEKGFTKRLADYILQLQISTSGLGRRDLVQLVQQRTEMFDMSNVKQSKDIFR